jgi:hypothetical protein
MKKTYLNIKYELVKFQGDMTYTSTGCQYKIKGPFYIAMCDGARAFSQDPDEACALIEETLHKALFPEYYTR